MTQIAQIITTAGGWLLKQQDPDSGGWADRPGGHVNTLNTAEAMIALIDGGCCKAGAATIRRAVLFLIKHQTKDGKDRGSWPREIVSEQGSTVCIPDLIRSAIAIQALIKAGEGVDDDGVKMALEWMLAVRDKDSKGWGYAPESPGEITPTCFAVTALLEAHAACPGTYSDHIRESLKYLVENHYNNGGEEINGSFGSSGELQGVHTIFAALVLQFARVNNILEYTKQEIQAIDWLLLHPDQAIRLREEWIAIHNSKVKGKAGGYGYMFMTDTLLIKLLLGADGVNDRGSRSSLARDAMNSLKDKLDDSTGAFYGSRLFSWSTAKALDALSSLQKSSGAEYPDFPQRQPEYKGLKVGPIILGFSVLLSVFGFYLMVYDKFNMLAFGFFAIMMLAALLAYGMIGEKTFKELFGGISSLQKNR
jgi:hypothetical protein